MGKLCRNKGMFLFGLKGQSLKENFVSKQRWVSELVNNKVKNNKNNKKILNDLIYYRHLS